MSLVLVVAVIVLVVVILLGLLGYLIDRSADRHEGP
jgi:hypothetical protein